MNRQHPEALLLARNIVDAINPFCERIEIAGSLRRKKPVVKDIEICVIPKWDGRVLDPQDLFQTRTPANLLYEDWVWRGSMFTHIIPPIDADWSGKTATSNWPTESANVRWIKPGTSEIIPWQVEPSGFYWRGLLPGEVKLDLFLTTPEKWGVIFLLRTGSKEFNLELIEYGRRLGLRIDDGRLLDERGMPLRTLEEEDVFNHLGLEYVEPAGRKGAGAIKPKGGEGIG